MRLQESGQLLTVHCNDWGFEYRSDCLQQCLLEVDVDTVGTIVHVLRS